VAPRCRVWSRVFGIGLTTAILSALVACTASTPVSPSGTGAPPGAGQPVPARPVTLAGLYFAVRGREPADVIVEQQRKVRDCVLEVQNGLTRVDGNYMSRQDILDGLSYLDSDDGAGQMYAAAKGRAARLGDDLIPFWAVETARSEGNQEWRQFVEEESALQKQWLAVATTRRAFLRDQKLPYDALDRYGVFAVFETSEEIKQRKTGLLKRTAELLEIELGLVVQSLYIVIGPQSGTRMPWLSYEPADCRR
jgi:hypothetical protein